MQRLIGYHRGELALTLQILGEFGLRRGAEPVELRAKKAQALLAYVALAGGKSVARDTLAGLLWGEMSEDRARHNLRQAMSEIRRAAGQEILRTEAGGVSIDPEQLACDAVLLRDGAARDDPKALELYGGELLSTLDVREAEFDAWVSTQRANLRALVCELSGRIGNKAFEAGDDDGCIDAARKRLSIDPACEQSHRLLMKVYARRGQRSDAIRQFDQCKETLQRTLGVQPQQETRALLERIRGGEASAPPEAPPLPLPDKPSVAVLPFANLSGDAEQVYFSDGITEDIIIGLCRFPSLFVIARNSSFAFRDAGDEPRVVGRRLGVHYVVQGSVRRAGDRVRIAVQLVDASTGRTVWAERYDRELRDIFAVQDEVTSTVVATVAGRVEAAHLDGIRRVPTDNLAAYDCLLKGKDHHHRYSKQDNTEAQQWLTRAIELDPDFALAHAWMACVLAQSHSFTPNPSMFDRAYESVTRANELDDGESECHRILAAYHLIRRQHADAQRHQTRAMALNPNDDRIVCQNGELMVMMGDPVGAIEWIERAIRLNPHHPDNYHYEYARALYGAGRHAEATRSLREIGSPRLPHLAFLAASLSRFGDEASARVTVSRALELRPHLTAAGFARSVPYRDPKDADRLSEDLRAAGLP